MEAVLTAIRSNRCETPLTVGVGHTSALMSAGLTATLARVPGCQVRQWETTPGACARNCATRAQLIFGDAALLRHCRTNAKRSSETCSFEKARFVWLTARDDPRANACEAAGDVAERLSVVSTEEEVFAIVQRLTDAARGTGLSVPAHRQVAKSESARPIRPVVRGGLAPTALRRVREHVEQHFSENINSGTLATIAGLSPGHFNRAFRQSTGFSPHRYLVQRRVAAATELLEKTDRSLADVALETGFAHQSHFCHTYLVVTGETPGACRRRYR